MEIAFYSKVHNCSHKFLVEKTKQNKSLWCAGPLEKSKDAYKIIKKVCAGNYGWQLRVRGSPVITVRATWCMVWLPFVNWQNHKGTSSLSRVAEVLFFSSFLLFGVDFGLGKGVKNILHTKWEEVSKCIPVTHHLDTNKGIASGTASCLHKDKYFAISTK